MKIYGTDEEINTIDFRHEGNQFNFRHISSPLEAYNLNADLEPIKEAMITFSDLKEVDELINMLEMFKKHCTDYMGCWEYR